MKKIVFLAAALMASMFILTSCEKENAAEMVETSNLKAANFVLIQKGYVNENGFVGDLYCDENNPEITCFYIYEQQTQTRAHQQNTWTGTLDPIYCEDGNPSSGIHSYFCNTQKDATNCNALPGGGFETSVEFYHKKK